jgi:hypothetical protein
MHLMVAHAFVQPLAIFPNVHLMPQTTYVLPSEESQQIFTIFNAAVFRHHAERGLSIFAVISAAVGPQMREGTPSHLETASSISLTEVTTLPSRTSVPAAVLISG